MNKVIVAMSGGVDSSVAALLLLEQGYQVEGLFMKNWDDDDGTDLCSSAEDLIAAAQVCETLGLTLHTVNFAKQYKERVFAHFLSEYDKGRTPNPDILCNREIKFDAFKQHAQQLGGDWMATGHYVRADKSQNKDEIALMTGLDSNKDQSYFLYGLDQSQLHNVVFPVGELHKDKVRAKANEAGFNNHDRPDSTGICFIGERHFQQFLARYLPEKPGPIVTVDGEEIGTHRGAHYYTIGQRRGLGIGGVRGSDELPWYVIDKSGDDNTLTVAQGINHPKLLHNTLRASEVHWIGASAPKFPLECRAKIRYQSEAEDCIVDISDKDQLTVRFKQKQRAITPGQSVVFYLQEVCLGGAIIDATIQ